MMFPAYFSHSGNAKAKRMAHSLALKPVSLAVCIGI